NAVIVMDDADLDLAVQGIVCSAFGTSGQRCTACSRVIVHESIKEQLEKRLLAEIPNVTVGDGLQENIKMGPIINEPSLRKIENYVQIGIDVGAKLLTGGNVRSDGHYYKGYFFAPTVFMNVTPDMRIAQEEIFGPVLSIIPV